jgi:hypothetical protein
MTRYTQDHFPAVHKVSEHNAHPSTPSITFIPAFAGIHLGRSSAPPTTIDLPNCA